MPDMPGTSSIADISDEDLNAADEGYLADALFAAMSYTEIVQAGSMFLADEDLLDFVPAEVLPAVETAADAQ